MRWTLRKIGLQPEERSGLERRQDHRANGGGGDGRGDGDARRDYAPLPTELSGRATPIGGYLIRTRVLGFLAARHAAAGGFLPAGAIEPSEIAREHEREHCDRGKAPHHGVIIGPRPARCQRERLQAHPRSSAFNQTSEC